MSLKNEFKIFFAIPFDTMTRQAYMEICEDLKDKYKKRGYNLITQLGNKPTVDSEEMIKVGQKSTSQEYLDIMIFKAQNKDLHHQFYEYIQNSHILIADLTHNNPNVHVELGMAFMMGKNILRVTGRSVKELGFDVQNLEVTLYKNKAELTTIITNYLDRFIKIKELEFSSDFGELYFESQENRLVPKDERGMDVLLNFDPIRSFGFRDGGVQFDFKFLKTKNDMAWAGIYFRVINTYAGTIPDFSSDCYLLYLRKNGSVELAAYPGLIKEHLGTLTAMPKSSETIKVLINVLNDEIEVKFDVGQKNQTFRSSVLRKQAVGSLIFGAYEAWVEFSNLKLVNRDTI